MSREPGPEAPALEETLESLIAAGRSDLPSQEELRDLHGRVAKGVAAMSLATAASAQLATVTAVTNKLAATGAHATGAGAAQGAHAGVGLALVKGSAAALLAVAAAGGGMLFMGGMDAGDRTSSSSVRRDATQHLPTRAPRNSTSTRVTLGTQTADALTRKRAARSEEAAPAADLGAKRDASRRSRVSPRRATKRKQRREVTRVKPQRRQTLASSSKLAQRGPGLGVTQLRRAHALLSSRPDQALVLVRDHAARHGSALEQERERVWIEALVRLKRIDEAGARAWVFGARFPTSAYLPRIQALVGEARARTRRTAAGATPASSRR